MRQAIISFISLFAAVASTVLAPHLVLAQDQATISEEVMAAAHVDNFARVSSTIWRGAQPSDEALKKLALGGIRTVVDLRMEGEDSQHEGRAVESLGLRYVHIPLGFMRPPPEKVLSFLRVVTNSENQPVFVHCRQGADRTGVLCAIYHRLVDDWTFEQCWVEMRLHHFKPFLISLKKAVEEFSSADFRKMLAMPPLPQKTADKVVAVKAHAVLPPNPQPLN